MLRLGEFWRFRGSSVAILWNSCGNSSGGASTPAPLGGFVGILWHFRGHSVGILWDSCGNSSGHLREVLPALSREITPTVGRPAVSAPRSCAKCAQFLGRPRRQYCPSYRPESCAKCAKFVRQPPRQCCPFHGRQSRANCAKFPGCRRDDSPSRYTRNPPGGFFSGVFSRVFLGDSGPLHSEPLGLWCASCVHAFEPCAKCAKFPGCRRADNSEPLNLDPPGFHGFAPP